MSIVSQTDSTARLWPEAPIPMLGAYVDWGWLTRPVRRTPT